MASAAFKSTTGRTPIGKQSTSCSTADGSRSINRSSSSSHRRSRSLSRFSRPIQDDDETPAPVPRARFVNTTRGSGFPEISLDDLAVEFLDSANRGRSGFSSWSGEVSEGEKGSGGQSQRRGRSVSRVGEGKGSGGNKIGHGRVNSEFNNRRRRSVSVVRYQISDSESDLDQSINSSGSAKSKSFSNKNSQAALPSNTVLSNHRQGLRRSLSQKDLKSHSDYSSYSSALTDDEEQDGSSNNTAVEKTIRAVYAQKAKHPVSDNMNGGFYEVVRKEIRNAVEEIKMELELDKEQKLLSALASKDCLEQRNPEVLHSVSKLKKNYSMQLEQSEKRKQDLLGEIMLEEKHGKELSKIVKELRPDTQEIVVERSSQPRKRSNDRSKVSKQLIEEAEKYIEDFISNVEDTTDISSLDGERSDTSSSLGGISKKQTSFQTPPSLKTPPDQMDGVVFPWLQWETSNDTTSPLSSSTTKDLKATPKNDHQGPTLEHHLISSISSYGSSSPGIAGGQSATTGTISSKYRGIEAYTKKFTKSEPTKSQLDIDEYLKRQSEDEFLLEKWSLQQRSHSGSLLLCHQTVL